MTFEELAKKLDELPPIETPETTFFDMGGRGHYENPTSDVLSFYLNTDKEHGLGNLVLEALFNALNEAKGDKPLAEGLSGNCTPDLSRCKCSREVTTSEDYRIDLVLEGEGWVLAIENKIYHEQVNPFDAYEEHIKKEYIDKNLPNGKKKPVPIYVVLSPDGIAIDKDWHGLSYKILIENLTSALEKEGHRTLVKQPLNFNKWLIFLRDFILNLERIVMVQELPDKTIGLIVENMSKSNNKTEFSKLIDRNKDKFNKLKHLTIQNLGEKLKEKLKVSNKVKVKYRDFEWGPTNMCYPVLYFYKVHDNSSHNNSSVVLAIDGDLNGDEKSLGIWSCAWNINIEEYDKAFCSFQEIFKDPDKNEVTDSSPANKNIIRFEHKIRLDLYVGDKININEIAKQLVEKFKLLDEFEKHRKKNWEQEQG